MKVGELVFQLGIKGATATVGAVKQVTEGLGAAKSMSIETKAAILAVVYGFEQLVMGAGRLGAGLAMFNTQTGISIKTLQQYQYAARQVGVSNDEITSSFKGISNMIGQMELNKGMPDYIRLLLGSGFDTAKKTDPVYVAERITAQLQKLKPEIAMIAGKAAGLSEGFITAAMMGQFKPSIMSQAPTLNSAQAKAVQKAMADMQNIRQQIEMELAKFLSKHGDELVKDIKLLVPAITMLASSFVKLAESMKVFQALGLGAAATGATISGVADMVGQATHPVKAAHDVQAYLSRGGQGSVNIAQNLIFQYQGVDEKSMSQSQRDMLKSAKLTVAEWTKAHNQMKKQ